MKWINCFFSTVALMTFMLVSIAHGQIDISALKKATAAAAANSSENESANESANESEDEDEDEAPSPEPYSSSSSSSSAGQSNISAPACPFQSNVSTTQVIQQISSALQSAQTQETCRAAVPDVDLAAQVSRIRGAQNHFSCNELRNIENEYDFVTSTPLDGAELGYIPKTFQSCYDFDDRTLDTDCVTSTYNRSRSGFLSDCRENATKERWSLKQNSLDEALILNVSALQAMIENDSCSASEIGTNLLRTGVGSIPLLASSVTGFGLPLAVGAQLVSSIFSRLLKKNNSFENINALLGEESTRCLYFQALTIELDCNREQRMTQPDNSHQAQFIRAMSNLSSELEAKKINSTSLLRALEAKVRFPGTDTVGPLRKYLEDLQTKMQASKPSPYQVQQINLISSLLKSPPKVNAGESAAMAISEAVVSDFKSLPSSEESRYLTLWQSSATSPLVLPAATPVNTNLNASIGYLTKQLISGNSRQAYGFSRVETLSASAANPRNSMQNRKISLKERFNICAYNPLLLLADSKKIDAAVRSRDDVFSTISTNPEVMARFRKQCGEFSCIINMPTRFPHADDFKKWQCQILSRPTQVLSALESRLESWGQKVARDPSSNESLCPASALSTPVPPTPGTRETE